MIVTVTLDPAVDVTYDVDRLDRGRTNRVRRVRERPGGEGLDVARALHAIGEHAMVVAPLGGPSGRWITEELSLEGLPVRPVPVGEETRRTVTVVDEVRTVLSEPGPQLHVDDWAAVVDAAAGSLVGARALVVSGDAPPGSPLDLYARLVAAAETVHLPSIVATSGPVLMSALAARPTVVVVEQEQMLATTGRGDADGAARLLLRRGASWVVVADGQSGALAVSAEATWRVAGAAPSPAGHGDVQALVAGLASALAEGVPWPDPLRHAVAVRAAAVDGLAAGVDADAYRSLLPGIVVEPSP